MSLEAITEIARRHLKLQKRLGHLMKQISLVDRGVRMGFICGPPQPHFSDLLKLMHQLHLEKYINEGCTVIGFHEEICIVNIPKILDSFKGKLPIFINVSGELEKPVILETSSPRMQQFLSELREKISNIEENRIEFSSCVSLSAVLGFLGGYPIIYWCESDDNCLSMVPLKKLRASMHSEEILSFTVPEILSKTPKIHYRLQLWKSLMEENGLSIQESYHRELTVSL